MRTIDALVLTIVLSYCGSGLAIPTFQSYTVALFNGMRACCARIRRNLARKKRSNAQSRCTKVSR